MIYIVEDDSGIRDLVVYTLEKSGFDAMGFNDSKAFFDQINIEKPQLALLDIMLPGDEDGIGILKRLRASPLWQSIPVIMLTAKCDEYDKVVGLDCGADDYVTKPFGMMELISRIKAVLRRCDDSDRGILSAGDVTLDTRTHTVRAKGQTIDLTLKEFELLRVLLQNPGVVLTRDILIDSVWGTDTDSWTRTVDVHVRTLRAKLGESSSVIETIRGVGYRIRPEK